MHGDLLYNGGADIVRLILLIDTDPRGAAPTATSVFTADDINSFANPDNGSRYRILKDIRVCIDNVGENWYLFDWYIPLNFHVDYGLGTAATYADIATNSIWFAQVAASNNYTYLRYKHRYAFYDN